MAYMTKNRSFGPVLRAIRANLDLTQVQLAERLGVSFATVKRWEGGGVMPQRAARLAILHLKIPETLADEPEPPLTSIFGSQQM